MMLDFEEEKQEEILSIEEMLILANYIKQEIERDFESKFVTHNLADTIKVYNTIREGDGTPYVCVEIPAEMYDASLWKNKRALVFTGEGSYASEVDIKGGYSFSHKNYVQRAIDDAVDRFFAERNLEVSVKNG